jgi:hypothetical protein
MSYGMVITDSNGTTILDTNSSTINVIDSFDSPVNSSTGKTYTDPTLVGLANSGDLKVSYFEVSYGSYPVAQAPIKKTVNISVTPSEITLNVSGGNMNARILVITK